MATMIALLLGACTQGPPPLKPREPTGAPSDSLLVIGPGAEWPEHVDVPNAAFADDPEAAPYDSDELLPAPALDGLAIYPVWTPESEDTESITFIDGNGQTVSGKTYQSFHVCIGPDGAANAVLAREGMTPYGQVAEGMTVSTDVLDPGTGALLFTNPTSLWCLAGSDYAVMFEYSGYDFTGRGGVVSLKDRRIVVDLVSGWSFAAIDSHTIDVVTADGNTVRDLDTGQVFEHQYEVPRLPRWLRLPETYSRTASLVADTGGADGIYFRLGSDWTSDAFAGVPTWYSENTAVLVGDTPDDVRLVDRSGGVLAEGYSKIMPIGVDVLLACIVASTEACERTGVIRADGTWLVPPPDAEMAYQVVGYAEDHDAAAARLTVFGPSGLIDLVDVESGTSTPLPDAGQVIYAEDSTANCAGFAPQGVGGFGIPTWETPGGFVRADAKLVALPDGYHVAPSADDPLLLDRACETVTTINSFPNEIADKYPPELTFTSDGKMLAPGVSVKHTLGPGLTWVTWGDYRGYLTTDGHWLWRAGGPTQD